MILDVSDVSNPCHAEQDEEVRKVLDELGVLGKPRLHVYNKIDLVSREEREALHTTNNAVFVSAAEGTGLEALLAKIDEVLPADPRVRLRLRFPHSRGRELALVHEHGRIFAKHFVDGAVVLDAELPASLAERLSRYLER
jgi:GTP-binding protein HflX